MIGNKFFKYAQESHVQTRHCLEIDFIYDLHIHVYMVIVYCIYDCMMVLSSMK